MKLGHHLEPLKYMALILALKILNSCFIIYLKMKYLRGTKKHTTYKTLTEFFSSVLSLPKPFFALSSTTVTFPLTKHPQSNTQYIVESQPRLR